MNPEKRVELRIMKGTERGGKTYEFDEAHPKNRPIDIFFQETHEGLVLFLIFYTQACQWSRCLGCALPATSSLHHVGFHDLMRQVDHVMADPRVKDRHMAIRKVIVSNQGSVLDEDTFSSTALLYLVAQCNINFPNLTVLTLETRAEYVDNEELEFLQRALREGDTSTELELAIGFEAFDNRIRNEVFLKGLTLETFEALVEQAARHRVRLKCYFMQKPVPSMTDDDAVYDIVSAVTYLDHMATKQGVHINLHLNPTYAARGTPLAQALSLGQWSPPMLRDVARAALAARGKNLSVFIGLNDEGLAVPGGAFIRPGEDGFRAQLEAFNRSQDFDILERLLAKEAT